jgi:hypothetical protein
LHRQHEFADHEVVTFRRALEAWDAADRIMAEAEGAPGPERVRLQRLSVDMATSALRHWRTLKFQTTPEATRRPGRPSGAEWSPKRKAQYAQWRASMTETRHAPGA